MTAKQYILNKFEQYKNARKKQVEDRKNKFQSSDKIQIHYFVVACDNVNVTVMYFLVPDFSNVCLNYHYTILFPYNYWENGIFKDNSDITFEDFINNKIETSLNNLV